MATTPGNSTPPPPSTIHTPSTPKHGKEDNYEPYSPRRKSARVSQRSLVTRTPPANARANPRSPITTVRPISYSTSSPSSPQTAPKKKAPSSPPMLGGRRISGALNFESTASAASALGIQGPRSETKIEVQQASIRNNGMLPTPAKTPKKRPTENSSAIASVARNLFPIRGETVEEVMPSPKKRGRKKYTGFTLDSFEAEEEGPIAIYTDSHDRIPELDMSGNNPFYGESSQALPDPIKRSSKRRKVSVTGEAGEIVEGAEHRNDGLVYVFRGKKVFRKFASEDVESDSEIVDHEDLDAELSAKHLNRPLTRSSIKPRLLFPTPSQTKAKELTSQVTEDEEEAITDIEELALSTSSDYISRMATTPKAPKFAPVSPPTTGRVTRSKDAMIGSPTVGRNGEDDFMSSPVQRGRSENLSPFQGWRQTKSIGGGGKKRGGEPLNKGQASKKTRA